MVTKVNICDSLSDGAQTTSSTSSGYASHPSSNTNTEPAKLDVERRSPDNIFHKLWICVSPFIQQQHRASEA